MEKKNNKSQNDDENLSPEIVKKFVETQEKELEIRQQELAQRERESEIDYELAKKSIDAQERDRNKNREYFSGYQRRRYYFIGALSFLAILFLGFALWIGESNIAMEIVKVASYIIAGGLGGYAIGYNRAQRESSTDE